jgi:endonuclease/exonuclease/phosphatase family metal-dependent hydrolase
VPRLTVATLNLKKGELEWGLRAPWMLRQLADLQPDVIGFQEVDLRLDQGNWICRRLNDLLHDAQSDHSPYVIHHIANPRENVAVEALAVMTRLPVLAHEGFDYLFRNRVAHRVRIEVDSEALDVYNTHLHHEIGPEHNAVRVRQAEQLRDWIADRSGEVLAVLVGDLNATPGTRPIRILSERMRSAYEVHHGAPPATTVSPLGAHSDIELRGEGRVLDYIFVSDGVEVIDADLAFTEPAPEHPSVYASDHFGLVATLEVSP